MAIVPLKMYTWIAFCVSLVSVRQGPQSKNLKNARQRVHDSVGNLGHLGEGRAQHAVELTDFERFTL